MLLGKVLAWAAMRENKSVTWLPSYGAEVRGGTAHCMVIVSDTEIGSPYINKADTLIVMNQPSLERFKDRIEKKGLLLVNSSLVKENIAQNKLIIKAPFTDIAIKLGNIKVANMVALGYYIAHKKIVEAASIFNAMQELAPQDKKDLIKINQDALLNGMEFTE